MRRLLLALVAALVTVGAADAPRLEYRFEAVKSKVEVTHNEDSHRAAPGEIAVGGDRVRTGWLGRTEIVATSVASRFVVYPSTQVELGSETPGVLLSLERGKLEALFDKLVGRDDRLVATPGAVLAVRGTRYGVEVDRDGEAVLAVFEGRVEVQPRDPGMPTVSVDPGHLCRFGPRRAPQVGRAPEGFDERAWQRGGASRQMPDSGPKPGERPSTGQPGGTGVQQPRGHGKGGG